MKSAAGPDLERQAVGGLLWLTGGSGVRGVIKILTLIALARLVTPAAFGTAGAAVAIIGFVSMATHLGVGQALVQRSVLTPAHRRAATGWTILAGFGATAVVHVLSGALEAFFGLTALGPVLRLLAWSFPFMGVSLVCEALLQRGLRFPPIAVAEFVSYAIGYGLVGVALAWTGLGVWALAWAHLAKATLKCLVLLRFVTGLGLPAVNFRALSDLLGFGVGYTSGGMGTYLALEGDNLVVAKTLGADLLGQYGRAYELMAVPANALGAILDKVLFPTMSRVQDDEDRLGRAYSRSVALLAFAVIPVAAGTMILAPEIIGALLGPGWEGAVAPLRILAIAMYFRIASMISTTVARSRGAVFRVAWRSGAYAVLVIVGALAGQHWGIAGVASGVTVAISVNFLLVAGLSNRLTGLTWRDLARVHAWPLGWGGCAALVALGASHLGATLHLPDVLTLAAAALGLMAAVAGISRLLPGRTLGLHGPWITHLLRSRSPRPIRFTVDLVVAGYDERTGGRPW